MMITRNIDQIVCFPINQVDSGLRIDGDTSPFYEEFTSDIPVIYKQQLAGWCPLAISL
jgi:hypothetical protein